MEMKLKLETKNITSKAMQFRQGTVTVSLATCLLDILKQKACALAVISIVANDVTNNEYLNGLYRAVMCW